MLKTWDILSTLSRQKEIVIVMKIHRRETGEKIYEAIDSIPLSCLVTGNRGFDKIKRVLLGSLTTW
ncbi:unnamed protein product [Musa acuminata subsp. malaccensis]|uniref:(wild Malaysian banana) hypothetical protein n=1 Tax=Musa acuminata subsp. malaccensis TaxID=214687 RepID=A0A804K3H7_MUSAM|nr:unnamed protein product [Musa acuminata subsp. malaccensis]